MRRAALLAAATSQALLWWRPASANAPKAEPEKLTCYQLCLHDCHTTYKFGTRVSADCVQGCRWTPDCAEERAAESRSSVAAIPKPSGTPSPKMFVHPEPSGPITVVANGTTTVVVSITSTAAPPDPANSELVRDSLTKHKPPKPEGEDKPKGDEEKKKQQKPEDEAKPKAKRGEPANKIKWMSSAVPKMLPKITSRASLLPKIPKIPKISKNRKTTGCDWMPNPDLAYVNRDVMHRTTTNWDEVPTPTYPPSSHTFGVGSRVDVAVDDEKNDNNSNKDMKEPDIQIWWSSDSVAGAVIKTSYKSQPTPTPTPTPAPTPKPTPTDNDDNDYDWRGAAWLRPPRFRLPKPLRPPKHRKPNLPMPMPVVFDGMSSSTRAYFDFLVSPQPTPSADDGSDSSFAVPASSSSSSLGSTTTINEELPVVSIPLPKPSPVVPPKKVEAAMAEINKRDTEIETETETEAENNNGRKRKNCNEKVHIKWESDLISGATTLVSYRSKITPAAPTAFKSAPASGASGADKPVPAAMPSRG